MDFAALIQQCYNIYWLYRDTTFEITVIVFALLLYNFRKGLSTDLIDSTFDVFWITPIQQLAPTVLITLALGHFMLYLVSPGFADYGEPVIPLLGSNLLNGGQVYSNWNDGQAVVGSNYGPYVFIFQIVALISHPSIVTSKLVGIVFAFATLCLFYVAVNRHVHSARSLMLCALLIVILTFQLHRWFWNRPDTMLITVVALATLLYDRVSPNIYIMWIGLLAGIATNLKLFGALYLAPLALASIVTPALSPTLVISMVSSSVLFIVAVGLPFLIPSVCWSNYINNIFMMPHQGFDFSAVLQSVCYGCLIFALPAVVISRVKSSLQDRAIAALTVVSMLVAAVVSGKPGGGPAYMMPFAPLALYLTARLSKLLTPSQHENATRIEAASLGLLFVCGLPVWSYSWLQMTKQVLASPVELKKAAELRGLFQVFPAAEMGHGLGPGDSRDEFYRVEKAFLGETTRFDYVNYADQRAAGVKVAVLYPLFQNCRIPTWILARSGGKFDGFGYREPLFDDNIRNIFRRNYELSREGQFYDVWSCKAATR